MYIHYYHIYQRSYILTLDLCVEYLTALIHTDLSPKFFVLNFQVSVHLCHYLLLQVDPFHTLFGIAGLSLLGNRTIKPVNPVFCMPQETIDRRKLNVQMV